MTNTFYSCHVFSLRLFQVCEWNRRTSVFTDVDVCKPLNEHIFPCTRMYAYNSCMCKSVVLYGAQVIFQKHLFNDWIESTCPTWFGTTGRPRKSEGLTSPWISKPWYVTFRAISHTSGGRKSSWWSRTHQCGNSGCKSVGCLMAHCAGLLCASEPSKATEISLSRRVEWRRWSARCTRSTRALTSPRSTIFSSCNWITSNLERVQPRNLPPL